MILPSEKPPADPVDLPPPRHPSINSRSIRHLQRASTVAATDDASSPPSYTAALSAPQAGPSRVRPPALPPKQYHSPVSLGPVAQSTTPVSPQSVIGNSTNNLCITTRSEPITGAFRIDPMLCSPEILTKRKKGRRKKRHQRKWADDDRLNAYFESRKGDITLDLGVVGAGGQGRGTTARIETKTRKGNVELDVFELHGGRHISLDVMTKDGDIRLFVPPNFRGILNLFSKKGDLKILPGLARTMRVLSAKPEEMLIMIGSVEGLPSSEASSTWEGDFAQLTSRKGSIMVGIYGEDKVPSNPSWWKKVVSLFSPPEKDT